MKIRSVRRGLAGVCVVSLALASAGCTSNEDRSRSEKASQENVSLKTQVTEMTAEQEQMKKDLAALTKERDQYKNQLATANTAADDLRTQNRTAAQKAAQAEEKAKSLDADLVKARGELEAAKKTQGDAEQMAVKLKAAEDGVNAARSKAADAEKSATAAADAANKAKEQAAQLAQEKAALQERVNALAAELAKKNAAAGAGNANK